MRELRFILASMSLSQHPRFVYVLADPSTSEIMYVGETENPERRLALHAMGQATMRTRDWARALRSRGLRPRMVIVDVGETRAESRAIERAWIEVLGRGRLLN